MFGGWKPAAINAVKYTIKKYRVIFPYTFITVFVSLILIHGIGKEDLTFVRAVKALFESLMIIRGDSNVGVLWYLAAMLPVLPILVIFVQKTSIKVYGTLSLIYIFLWYFVLGRFDDCFVPTSYFRAVGGLALGVLAYWLKLFMERRLSSKKKYTAIMVACIICPIVLTALNIVVDRLILIIFVIGFSLVFSSKTDKIKANVFTDMCGKLSLPLYLVHLNIMDLITYFCRNYSVLNSSLQYILLFTISTVCTLLLMYAGQAFDRLLRKVGI